MGRPSLAAALAAALAAGAGAPSAAAAGPPKVTGVAPIRVEVGRTLTVRGRNFGPRPPADKVIFRGADGRRAAVVPGRASSRRLRVRLSTRLERILRVGRDGQPRPTRLRLRIAAGRRYGRYAPLRISPVVYPRRRSSASPADPEASRAPRRGAQAVMADRFVDSVGVNVHVGYFDTAYNDYPQLKSKLLELGVRHIREDGIVEDKPQYYFDRLNDLAASGIRTDAIVGACCAPLPSIDSRLGLLRSKVRGAVESVEGPNEWDLSGPSWPTQLRSFQQRLYETVKADPSLGSLPVIGPALGGGTGAHDALGDISSWLDRGNVHSYPGAQPQWLSNYGRTFEGALADARKNSGPVKPVIPTETGYHNATGCSGCVHHPISHRGSGIYVPRLFLDHFSRGVDRTYLYELFDWWPNPGYDDPERHFGLVWPGSYDRKPAFIGLRNLIDVLEDPGAAFTPGSLAYEVSSRKVGVPVRSLLLQKRDGTFYLAIWQEEYVWNRDTRQDLYPTPTGIHLAFDRTHTVDEIHPAHGTAPVATHVTRTTDALAIPADDVLILRIH